MTDSFDADSWREELAKAREGARHYFLHEFDWRGARKAPDFEGPVYYPIEEKWRIPARLDRDTPETGRHVQLETSIGDLRDFENYGALVFDVEGQEQRLTAYRSVPTDRVYDELFVPFRDATSGKATYGAGRYMDIPRHEGENYVIDFNTAYNPLCAYSPRYNCPYPPAQNRLKIAVEAGEKSPPADH